jgi:hypothetical protein
LAKISVGDLASYVFARYRSSALATRSFDPRAARRAFIRASDRLTTATSAVPEDGFMRAGAATSDGDVPG